MKAPHRVGQAFEVKLIDAARAAGLLRPDGEGGNYRAHVDKDDPELVELAASIKQLGQLQRIGLYWTGRRYALAFGFRRVSAMWWHREAHGFSTVKAERVSEDTADIARLVENLDRVDPTSYETARYLFELHEGERGEARPIAWLAEKTGKARSTLENLIRFYRVLPEEVREAWRLDRERRFTFRVLAELAALAQGSEAEALERARALLGAPLPEARARKPKVEPAAAPRFGRRVALRLARRLERAGARLQADDRAPLVHRLLLVSAGKRPATDADQIVSELLAELGVREGGA